MSEYGNTEYLDIGSFSSGEIPDPLRYTFLDADGVAINMSGGVADFKMSIDGGNGFTPPGTIGISQLNVGIVEYAWDSTDMASPAHYEAQFSVAFSGQVMHSPIFRWWVYQSIV